MASLKRRLEKLEESAPSEWDSGPLCQALMAVCESFETGERPELDPPPKTDRAFWGPEDDREASLFADLIDVYLESGAEALTVEPEPSQAVETSETM